MLDDNRVNPTTVVSDERGLMDVGASVLAVPVWPAEPEAEAAAEGGAPWLGPGAADVAEMIGVDLLALLEREQMTGKAGQLVSVPVLDEGRGAGSPDGDVDVTRVILVGLGDGGPAAHRRAGASLARAVRGEEQVASTVTAASDHAGLRAFIDGMVLATFALDTYRSAVTDPDRLPARTLVLAGVDGSEADVAGRASIMAQAAWFGRELVHTLSNVKDPAWLAARAVDVGRATGVDVHVRDEKKLASEGFGGLVAVGMGSDRPPRLIAMRYEPPGAGRDTPHVVLVGKGITFDTGGLSLKPRESMVSMKTDMSGGAVVMAVLSALPDLDVQVRVTGLVAAAENMPGASAQRPSDVIRQYDGTTVEVLNTDAEGRLVLADAIAYAAAELEPTAIVDVATLTGAATVGLGRTHAALYATDDELAEALGQAGTDAGEPLWRMPLVDDYRRSLESTVADVAHIETEKMGGGSITAALFLERFARGLPWAHLDIAGTGRADKDRDELVKGGTAFGVRALLTWLTSVSSPAST